MSGPIVERAWSISVALILKYLRCLSVSARSSWTRLWFLSPFIDGVHPNSLFPPLQPMAQQKKSSNSLSVYNYLFCCSVHNGLKCKTFCVQLKRNKYWLHTCKCVAMLKPIHHCHGGWKKRWANSSLCEEPN